MEVVLVHARHDMSTISKAAANRPLCRRWRLQWATTEATSRGVIEEDVMGETPAVEISATPTATRGFIWAAAAVWDIAARDKF